MALCWPATPSEVKFAADSPLEGAGFEPSVPLSVLTVLGPSFVIDQVRAGRGYRFALDEARSWSGGVKVANLVLKE